ncbi:MAG: glycosyltransferase family 4 protein [Pseudomonadota bacterium]
MTSLKIGLFTPAWPGSSLPNGIVTSTRNLARGLKELGHLPVILSNRIEDERPIDIPAVRIRPRQTRIADRLLGKFDSIAGMRRAAARTQSEAVLRAIAEPGLDVLLMEETHGWAGLVQKRVPIPVIVVLRGPWILHKELQSVMDAQGDASRIAAEGRALRAAPGLISPSRNVLRIAQEHYDLGGVPAEVIPNAAQIPEETSAEDVPSDLPQGDILFVGRFDDHKGGDVVLEAVARMRSGGRVTFVGPDRGVMRQGAGTLHIEEALTALPEEARERVAWIGLQPREAVAALRRRHAIAVVASRYENFGNVAIEAMAAGQAIVSTNVGGLPEMYDDGVSALLIPPGDPDAMARALDRLVADTAFARSLGEAARDRVDREFSIQRVAGRVADFAATTIERHGRR